MRVTLYALEGISASKIALVGNVMIDTLFRLLPKAKEIDITEKFGVSPNEYALLTLHRPSNVDVFENAKMFVESSGVFQILYTLYFPSIRVRKSNSSSLIF